MNIKPVSLDVIQVNEPCTQPWERMTGDERVRYCEGCRKHVYNLSAMSRTEAERLVCEGAGSLCVRFARGEDGRVQTLEYRAPVSKARGWRFWTVLSTCAASLVAGANGYLLARSKPTPPAATVLLGKRAAPIGTPMMLGVVAMPATPPTANPAAPQPLPATDPAEIAGP